MIMIRMLTLMNRCPGTHRDQSATTAASCYRAGSRLLRATIDTGWLYLLAGLALISAAVLIPPADNLVQLEYQKAVLEQQELSALDMLEAYDRFQDEVMAEDPVLIERLAAAYFNQIPGDREPLAIVGISLDARIDQWISDTIVPRDPVPWPTYKNTFLRRWCSPLALTSPHEAITSHDRPLEAADRAGTADSITAQPTPSDALLRPNPRRLWIIAAGAILALTGLLIGKPTNSH